VAPQQHADSITSIFGEFGFPPPPSFVMRPAADRDGFDVPIDGDSTAPSVLPRLFSQKQWSQLNEKKDSKEEGDATAAAKTKPAKGKRAASSRASSLAAADLIGNEAHAHVHVQTTASTRVTARSR